jgi:hypothetical protein
MRFTFLLSALALSSCTQDFDQYGFGGDSPGRGGSSENGGTSIDGGSSAGGNSNGGAAIGGGSSSGGSVADGASSAVGGSSADGGGGDGGATSVTVNCNRDLCVNQVCCFNNGEGSASCTDTCEGPFVAAACDGPEDCGGLSCCGDETSGTKCAPQCDGVLELCNESPDTCTEGTCTDSRSGLPDGFMVCDEA